MSGYYELECNDSMGFSTYYYFYSHCAIRNPKSALGYAPDAMRIVVEERDDHPYQVRIVNVFEYTYKKYFKKAMTFRFGYRVNWEKENKEYRKRG